MSVVAADAYAITLQFVMERESQGKQAQVETKLEKSWVQVRREGVEKPDNESLRAPGPEKRNSIRKPRAEIPLGNNPRVTILSPP